MFFKRKIYAELLEWKKLSHGTSALLIEGARRIGKSTVTEEFAKNEYDDYLILDFTRENSDIKRNFQDNLDNLDVFFRNLFLLKGRTNLKERKSLIIFDEVQLFPLARQAIKYLVKDGRYDYIETGSSISIKKHVKDILIPSEETKLKMYPMDFEEFLWAQGDSITMSAIRDAFESRKPLGDAIHRKIMTSFRTYMAVGGMPQAVEALTQGRSYQEIDFVKRNILSLYEDDLRTYDKENHTKASAMFRAIPEQLSSHNSHFKLSSIDKNARIKNCMNTIDCISESMMANKCLNITDPEISLALYTDQTNFKLYMGDTGLLVTQIMKTSKQVEKNLYKSLIFDKLGINQGLIMENAVAQMLKSRGYDLYFHEFLYQSSNSEKTRKYEIDFITVRNNHIVPIEVKSSGYRNHKSFDYFSEKYPIKINERFLIYTKDLAREGNITYLPIYMTGLL